MKKADITMTSKWFSILQMTFRDSTFFCGRRCFYSKHLAFIVTFTHLITSQQVTGSYTYIHICVEL